MNKKSSSEDDVIDSLELEAPELSEVGFSESENSELAEFNSAEIEDVEELTADKMTGILEALLFATDRPISIMTMKSAFHGTNIRAADIREALEKLEKAYEQNDRGVLIKEVSGGFQLRTKPEFAKYLKQTVKARPFKLSGQALEVLSIVAYKQPCTKASVDEIRGVESGHLMRGLLDRGLMRFAGKSDAPGRPMQYETTKKFLEIFGLRNINELPTLSEIDQLIPVGIGEETEAPETLSDITGSLSKDAGTTYSQGEEELTSISEELGQIATTTEFFEAEKLRQKKEREAEKARDIRERMLVGEAVTDWESKWLTRYEAGEASPETP